MRPAILIYNPKSGRQLAGRLVPQLLDILERGGFAVAPMATSGPGDATRIAREEAARGEIEVAFALGGDGTLREVAAGLVGGPVALGPLPGGTTNVLAIELGLTRRPLEAARELAAGSAARPFDVGFAGTKPFLMMASAGIDAAIMARQNSELKRRIGQGAVALEGLRSFFTYDYPPLEIEVDGVCHQASFFAVCNIPFYGGPLRMAPAADPRDGLLDVVLLHAGGKIVTASFLASFLAGAHLDRPGVSSFRASKLLLRGPLPFGLQVDGDVFETPLPVEIGVRPRALQILVPR
jgi:diacylglycerol kinase (ATP)